MSKDKSEFNGRCAPLNYLEEIWMPLVGYEGHYSVSNEGNVACIKFKKTRYMKKHLNRKGYLFVVLSKDGRHKNTTIHKLVLQTFKGPRPKGLEASHIDGNKLNNNINNLRWESRLANMRRKHGHGTMSIGIKNGNAKLTEKEVGEIKYLLSKGCTQRKLSKCYSISKGMIYYIAKGKNWKNVAPLQISTAALEVLEKGI